MSRRKIFVLSLMLASVAWPALSAQGLDGPVATWIVRAIGTEVSYRPSTVAVSDGGSIAYVGRNSPAVNEKIWFSRDSGMTWGPIESSPSALWTDIKTSTDGQIIVAIGDDPKSVVWMSNDGGQTWTKKLDSSTVDYRSVSMSSNGSVILISTNGDLLLSIDSGDNFAAPPETVNDGSFEIARSTPSGCGAVSVSGDGQKLFAACTGDLAQSTDGGLSWSAIVFSNYSREWTTIDSSEDGAIILAVANEVSVHPGAFLSIDSGDEWSEVAIGNETFGSTFEASEGAQGSMSRDGSVMIVSRSGDKPWFSTNGGSAWTEVVLDAGLAVTDFALSEHGDFIYAAVENKGVVIRRTPLPTLSEIDVASDTPNGGSSFTLTGTGLDAMTTVTFGGVPGQVVATTATTATVVSPRHIPGVVDIVLSGPLGTVTLANGFTYTTISGRTISATSGSTLGGTRVVVSGNFYGAEITNVRFGGVDAVAIVPIDESSFTVITPPHAAGVVDIEVTSDFGVRTFANAFTYIVPTTPLLTETAIAELPVVDLGAGAMAIAGNKTTVTYGGFLPGEWVEVSISSTPILLATVQADANGNISVEITLPANLVGEHTLSVYAPVSERSGKQFITLVPAPVVEQILESIPATGRDVTLLPLAGSMLIAGLLIKRRSAVSAKGR